MHMFRSLRRVVKSVLLARENKLLLVPSNLVTEFSSVLIYALLNCVRLDINLS